MERYNYCCSRDGHGLTYGGFSAVFIQTFSIHHSLQFCVEDRYVDNPDNKRASEAGLPMVYRRRDIEHQIFIQSTKVHPLGHMFKKMARNGYFRLEEKSDRNASANVPVTIFPPDSVYRFVLRGFDFSLPICSDDDDEPETVLSGHVSVEMSLFFGHTVSMTYRFFFDGNAAEVTDPHTCEHKDACTDDIIALLSTFLAAEYWSKDHDSTGPSQTDINLETEMRIDGLWFDDAGNPLDSPRDSVILNGKGRTFDS